MRDICHIFVSLRSLDQGHYADLDYFLIF